MCRRRRTRRPPAPPSSSRAFSTDELLLAFIATDQISTKATTVTAISGVRLTWALVLRTKLTRQNRRNLARFRRRETDQHHSKRDHLSESRLVDDDTQLRKRGYDGLARRGGDWSHEGRERCFRSARRQSHTTRNGSWVVRVGNDFDCATARTWQNLAATGDTYWAQRQTNPTPSSDTTVTINDTAPAGDHFNLSICEIRPMP